MRLVINTNENQPKLTNSNVVNFFMPKVFLDRNSDV